MNATELKRCSACEAEKARTEFYPHRGMADGLLGKCKDCKKADTAKHRAENHAKICAYDRARFRRPERKANVLRTQRTQRMRDPQKARCRRITAYALRTKKLVPQPCVHCGAHEQIQAHHPDYAKPLDVVWCCFKCHREIEHGQRVEAT